MKRLHLVVIGNGMAGMRTVEELLRLEPDLYAITVFGAEPHANYNRILLSPLLAGEKNVDDIVIHSRAWYTDNGITLHSGDPVVSIDRLKRIVRSRSGREAPYDRLLIATGSNPYRMAIPGIDRPGVTAFRTIEDVESMLTSARRGGHAVVIGGGLLGLEAAYGLVRQGMRVTVAHTATGLLNRQLDPPAAALLKASLESRGLRFAMNAQTTEILGDDRGTSAGRGPAYAVLFADGHEEAADLVVLAVGIRPNIELAQKARLHCDRGIVVDDTLQSYDPRIYAVGECVQHRGETFGIVAPLWEQARVCATHLAEFGIGRYATTPTATRLKVTGIDVFSGGDFIGGEGREALVFRDARRGIYKRLVLRDQHLVGAVLYGDVQDGNWYLDLMQQRSDIRSIRDRLIFGQAHCDDAVLQAA